MTFSTQLRVDAVRGMFLGAAVGDALGWPQELRGGQVGGKKAREGAEPRPEFRSWTRNGGHRAHRYLDPVGAGEYSDDTQLLLATARACLVGNEWWSWLVEIELPTWPLYQRGGGGAVLTAANSWAQGQPPWVVGYGARASSTQKRYADAGANGVAMRIAPHILWADSPDALIARVFRDGITTHGHPRALVGALTYAFVLHYATSSSHTLEFGELVQAASRGLVPSSGLVRFLPENWGNPELFCETWDKTNDEMAQLLRQIDKSLERGAMSPPTATLEMLGCTDPSVNGAGTVTAAGAIYLASRFASRPDGGLLSAAFLSGGDTDTLASMTGAILGGIHGTQWLGGLADSVQDGDYLSAIAEQSAVRRVATPPATMRKPWAARKTLQNLLVSGDASGISEFPDGRPVTVRAFISLDGGKTQRAQLLLEDGQSVFVDVESRASIRRDPALPTRGAEHQDLNAVTHSLRSLTATPLAPSSGALVRAVLPTTNLSRCAAFYAKLIGEDLAIRDRMLTISPWIALREAEHVGGDSAAEIVLAVQDLGAAIDRLGVNPSIPSRDAVVLKDPDGRVVRAFQARR